MGEPRHLVGPLPHLAAFPRPVAETAELTGERPGLLVNATPIGMAGGADAERLAFSEEQVGAARFAFDVVAVPAVERVAVRPARSSTSCSRA